VQLAKEKKKKKNKKKKKKKKAQVNFESPKAVPGWNGMAIAIGALLAA